MLTNSVDPNEMLHGAAFHLRLHAWCGISSASLLLVIVKRLEVFLCTKG